MSGAPADRFYSEACAVEVEDGFGVMLDDLRLKTPQGSPFVVPTLALAVACADEWAAQGEKIIPFSMPVTRVSFAAADLALMHGQALVDHILKYAETDLVCHRAESPGALVQKQAETWDPIVEWAEEILGVRLPVVTGIIAPEASPDIALLRMRVDTLDDFRLTGLAQAVGLSGSALIGFALMEERLSAEEAYQAAVLDDWWNQKMWGLDKEAQARLARMREEFAAVETFFTALR